MNKIVTIGFLEVEHAEKLTSYRKENEEFLRPFQATTPKDFLTLEKQTNFILHAKQNRMYDYAYVFGVFLLDTTNPQTENEELIGIITLSNIARGPFQNAYVGYQLAKKHNGKGYMTSALAQVVKFAFHTLELHRLQAAIMPHNLSSQRVVEKNQFKQVGLANDYLKINGKWEDHYLFERINEDIH